MANNNNFVNAGYWFTHSKTQLPISKIDAHLFTHLFCGYAGINSQTFELSILDSEKPVIDQFSKTIKENNPEAKTLLSIGGDDAKADRFAAMAANSSNRASFIGSFISKAREGNFDGVDIQWLYPCCVEEMSNFEALIIECYNGVVKEAKECHQPRLIVVATVFYSPYINNFKYPIQVIRRTLNWVNVIAYDIYTPTSFTQQTAPSSAFYNPNRISLSGYFGDSNVFAKIAGNPTTRDAFILSSIDVARAGEFDGLDLQWLYPSSLDEMNNFEELLRSWHQAIVDNAKNLSLPQLLLVATVSNVPYLQHNIQYPVDAIKQKLDWVNVLSYDFYTPTSSSKATGPSSAFHNPKANALSAHFGIQSWTRSLQNLPHKKIVFGIPFFGRAWKLVNSHQHDVFSKADGAATGDGISPDGQIYYSNVKKFIDDNQAGNEEKDPRFLIAYTYSGTTWIAYESEYTIAHKISLAKSDQVLGYFAFNIAADDDANTLAHAAKTNW